MTLFGGKLAHISFTIMASQSVIVLEYEGKSIGLPTNLVTKETLYSLFNVEKSGLHLKIHRNGREENLWALPNGNFFIPMGVQNAQVVAFSAINDDSNNQVLRY